MNLANVLVICLSIIKSTSPQTLNCIDFRFNHDVEDTAFQLLKTLKMPKESPNIKKSAENFNLYVLFKDLMKENCKTHKDIDNISKILDIHEEEYSSSNLVTNKLEEAIEKTIKNELVNKTTVIVQKPNINADPLLEYIREHLNKKVEKSLLNETNEPILKNKGHKINRKNNRKKGLEVWEYNITRRQKDEIVIENYSFLVSIFVNGEFVCSGAIIGKELVISAASCLHRVYLNKGDWPAITLRILSDYTYRGGYVISVTEAIFHPNYDHNTMRNNLVLLHVPKGSFTNQPKIRRVVFEETKADIKDDIKAAVKVLGWEEDSMMNRTHDDNIPMSIYQLKVYEVNECDEFYDGQFDSKIICSGFSNSPPRNKYAVGSAIIKNSMLLGVLSFTREPRRTKEARLVFTRIAQYVNWIHEAQRKIIPILHGVAEKVRKRNGTLIKARRAGSYDKNNFNKRLSNRKLTKIISRGQVGLDLTTFIDLAKTLSLGDVINSNSSLDAIKNSFLGAIVNSPDALYSLAAQYFQPQRDTNEIKINEMKTPLRTKEESEKEKEEFNLKWNVFFDEEVNATAITEVSTTIPNINKLKEHATQNSLNNMPTEKERNSFNTNQKKHLRLTSKEINDLAALIINENIRKKIRKRILQRKKGK